MLKIKQGLPLRLSAPAACISLEILKHTSMYQCGPMSTLSSPVRMQLARSWLPVVLATRTRLFSVMNPTTLRVRALKVGAVSRVPVDSSHVVINARPSAIQRSCTMALHVENLAHVSDQPVSTSVPSFVVKIVVLAWREFKTWSFLVVISRNRSFAIRCRT